MRCVLPILITALVGTTAVAQPRDQDVGKLDYEASCAICHGMDGKGDGMVAPGLKVKPTDLTVLAKNNRSVFPYDRVVSVVDGRAQIQMHGSREMPIWGTRYSVLAAEHYFDVPYDQEKFIRAHVLSLTDYLFRIQQK